MNTLLWGTLIKEWCLSLSKLNRVASSEIKFFNTDLLIHEVIMENAKKVHKMSATEIDNMVSCNHSSVSRSIKKVGFISWVEFVNSIIFEQRILSRISIDSFQEKINLEIINSQQTIASSKIKNAIDEVAELLLYREKTFIFYGHKMAGNIAEYLLWIFTVSGLFGTCTYFL